MANNYDVTTLVSPLPATCVKEEHKLLLGLAGFNAEADGDNVYLYTPAETGTDMITLSDYCDYASDSFDSAWNAMLADNGLEPFVHSPSIVELRTQLAGFFQSVGWDGGGVDWPDVVQIVLRDMPADQVSHLDFQGGYGCDKERPGEFGGYALRVTRDAIHCSESPGQFFARLDTHRNEADPVKALREENAAVAVFRAADVPDDVEDPEVWLRVHAKTIEDAMVRAGTEAIEDLSIQLGLPTPGGA